MIDCAHAGDRPIRVALCGLPAMVEDIVSALVQDVDEVEVVARLSPSAELESDFERSGADLLICAFRQPEMQVRWRDYVQRRSLAVINLVRDGREAHVYVLHGQEHPIDELTAESLVDVLRELHVGRGRSSPPSR